MDLADIVRNAIAEHAEQINHTALRWPNRPIQIELSWHPAMGKLEMVIKTVDHLPPYRLKVQ